jgi:hypothetical protein
MADSAKRTIPAPDPNREPLKTNVFQFALNSATALAPLFPYLDEGSIVPCLATFRGGPGRKFGRFQHFNTVDEVMIMFGTQGGRGRPGFVRVGPKLHLVGAPFEDPEDANCVRLTTITQRQLFGTEHREEYRFICEKCDRRLFLDRVDATPPKRGTQIETQGAHAPFITVVETYEAARKFNDSEEARLCKHCGHMNELFPIEAWGWETHVRQGEIVAMAMDSLEAAQSANKK